MKKTKESIIKKREKKKSDLEKTEQLKLNKKNIEYREKTDTEYHRLLDKAQRKARAYINRKFLEYDRKCKNEIRKLEGKEEKVYKKKKKLNLVEFAMSLMQENARLRDSDISGNGICISCYKFCTWNEHQWGHRWSRWVKNICLCLLNINLQCRWCNFTTWPRWDKVAAEKTNAKYDVNLDKKYGKWTSEQLRLTKEFYFKKDYDGKRVLGSKEMNVTDKDLEEYIEELIEENELRRKWKDFYKPWKKWRKIWEEYKS